MADPKQRGSTRREVLIGAAGLAAATLAPLGPLARAFGASPAAAARSVVGLSREPKVFDSQGRIQAALVCSLVDRALCAATGSADATEAMRSLFKPSDVVGIKINCLAGRGLSTHAEVVDALVARLVAAGVRASSVVVWDRTDRDLARARYTVTRNGPGPLYYGTNDDYEKEPIEAGSVGGCLSRILTRTVSAVINVPVLKDHDLAGISGALKSFYGAIHNPNKYHDHNCSPFVADLYAHESVRGKVRLTVFDALMPQCQGGPAFASEHAWPFGGVFASLDPVAADVTALRIISERRRERGLETLEKAGRAPLWLPLAARLGLGVDDPARIREVTL
jgi:uncharacterized protein (DUF362 family)